MRCTQLLNKSENREDMQVIHTKVPLKIESKRNYLNCKVARAFDHPTGKAGTSVSSHCLGKLLLVNIQNMEYFTNFLYSNGEVTNLYER